MDGAIGKKNTHRHREGERVPWEKYVCNFRVVREVLTEKVRKFEKGTRVESDQP